MSERTRYMYFVRHGQYDPSPSGGVLTALGRKQARRTGKRLAEISMDRWVSSDLSRAVQTAERMMHGRTEQRLGKVRVLREAMPSGFRGIHVPLAKRAKGKKQIEAIWERYFRPSRTNRNEIYVCHGNLIRALACRCLGQSWTAWTGMGTSHCGVTRFEVRSSGRVVLCSYNDTGHLPWSWVTSH